VARLTGNTSPRHGGPGDFGGAVPILQVFSLAAIVGLVNRHLRFEDLQVALRAAAAALAHVVVVRRFLLACLVGLVLFERTALRVELLLLPVVARGNRRDRGAGIDLRGLLAVRGRVLRVVRHALLVHPLVHLGVDGPG
jgi:hypothetical protein